MQHSIRLSPRPWSRRLIRDPQLHLEWAHLPVELYGRIVNFVASKGREGHDTLAILSRVSKSMQVEAERALYHTVSLHPIKTRSLCRTILRHQRLWCLVKKCEVFLMLGMTEYRLPDENLHVRLSQNLLASVRQLGRLRDLEVQCLPGSTNFKIGAALCSGTFHLKTFRCSDPFDPDLQAFFAFHPTIEELYVTASRINSGRSLKHTQQKSGLQCPTSKPIPEALPSLATLHALTARAAELLVVSRPVSRLDIARWDESCCLSKLTNRLARSTGPLRYLLVRSGFKLDANDVKTLADRLPELRFLGECVFVDKVGSSRFSSFVRSDLTVLFGFSSLGSISVREHIAGASWVPADTDACREPPVFHGVQRMGRHSCDHRHAEEH